MPHQIGFVEPAGGKLAHQRMLEVVRDFVQANGWQINRFTDVGDNHELLMQAPGMSGTEQIFLGMRTYQNAGADIYNMTAAAFTGYVPGNTFAGQPGAMLSGVPAHNQRIDYWLTMNGQRLVLAMKVGTPVYESLYLGKMLPYGRPTQYPYPVVCGGMLVGEAVTRFSDTAHSVWVKGGFGRATGASVTWNNSRLYFNDGTWLTPEAWPWNNVNLCGATNQARDTEGHYPLLPVMLSNAASGVFGELDGVMHITGFDNAVENTLLIDGRTYVVMQDVWRTSHIDYYAIGMDV